MTVREYEVMVDWRVYFTSYEYVFAEGPDEAMELVDDAIARHEVMVPPEAWDGEVESAEAIDVRLIREEV